MTDRWCGAKNRNIDFPPNDWVSSNWCGYPYDFTATEPDRSKYNAICHWQSSRVIGDGYLSPWKFKSAQITNDEEFDKWSIGMFKWWTMKFQDYLDKVDGVDGYKDAKFLFSGEHEEPTNEEDI